MPIKVISIDSIPMMQPDGSVRNEQFATLNIFHGGTCVAAPRVPADELPEGIQPGDFVRLTAA